MKPENIFKLVSALFPIALFSALLGSCGDKSSPTGGPYTPGGTVPPDTALALPDTVDFGPWGTAAAFVVRSNPPVSFNWTVVAGPGYLAVSPSSGRSGDTVTLTVDRTDSSLAQGVNIGAFWLNTDRDSLDGKQVFVRVVNDTDAPRLYIPAIPTLSFGMDRDTIMFTVHNTGRDSLLWNVSASSSWLHINPRSGTNWSFVRLTVVRSAMQGGIYRDTVVVSSNGGDTTLPFSIVVAGDTTTRSFLEYWPFHVGNNWAWLSPERNYWWALAVIDSFSAGGSPVWKVRADDSDGGYGEYYFTFANGQLTVVFDSSTLDSLSGIAYANCQGTLAKCWSDGYTFALFQEDVKPGDTYDPYWRANSEYIPGSLSALMSSYAIWANDSIRFADIPTGENSDCMGLMDKSVPNELYTIFARGVGPVVWDAYGLVHAVVNGVEYGAVPQNLQSLHFAVNTDTSSDLLYWFVDNNFSHVYFMGYRHGGMPVPTHILFEDSTGQPYGTIALRTDFQPVMWMMDTLTIGVHNINADDSAAADSAYDPTHAYHMMLTNNQQVDFYADIYPHDPREVLDSLENYLGIWLTHMRTLFDSIGIQSYNDLIAAGYIKGPHQEKWQAIASFIGIGAALVTYEMRDTALGKASRGMGIPGPFIPAPVKDMAKKTFEYFQDEMACKYCVAPGVPSVRMLQCQGLKAVLWSGQVCHDSYMGMTSATRCLDLCQVSLKCFTNICMPRDVAVADVQKVLFDNNQEVTPEEVRSLVQQNIDNLKPILSIGN